MSLVKYAEGCTAFIVTYVFKVGEAHNHLQRCNRHCARCQVRASFSKHRYQNVDFTCLLGYWCDTTKRATPYSPSI